MDTAAVTTPKGILRESIRWSIALSMILIVAGIFAILAPLIAGVAVEAMISWLLILGGVGHLILAWHMRGAGALLWELLIGLAYIVAGGYLFWHPLAGLVGLTLFLGAYLFVKGIIELLAFFTLRVVSGSGWVLFDAAVSLILACMIWRHIPSSAAWVIGTLIGFAILFTGVSRLALSLAAKKVFAAA